MRGASWPPRPSSPAGAGPSVAQVLPALETRDKFTASWPERELQSSSLHLALLLIILISEHRFCPLGKCCFEIEGSGFLKVTAPGPAHCTLAAPRHTKTHPDTRTVMEGEGSEFQIPRLLELLQILPFSERFHSIMPSPTDIQSSHGCTVFKPQKLIFSQTHQKLENLFEVFPLNFNRKTIAGKKM